LLRHQKSDIVQTFNLLKPNVSTKTMQPFCHEFIKLFKLGVCGTPIWRYYRQNCLP